MTKARETSERVDNRGNQARLMKERIGLVIGYGSGVLPLPQHPAHETMGRNHVPTHPTKPCLVDVDITGTNYDVIQV